MSEDFTQGSSKTKHAVVAAAAVLFLLILPGFVLAVASNMTGVELRIVSDDAAVADYEIIMRRRVPPDMALWLRVPEATSEKDMHQIIRHIVNTKYSRRTHIIFYVYTSVDPETNLQKRPSTHESDQTFKWALKSGIQRVK